MRCKVLSREQYQQEIDKLDARLTDLILEFWKQNADFSTWQFWFNVLFFTIPLLITILFIDRKKIFQICFFGYSFHVMFVYLDVFFTRFNYWDHPYFLIPYIPVSIPVDGSLVPVTFMFAYQISINRNWNFYVTSSITALLITFVAMFWQKLELLQLYNGVNNIHIFLADLAMSFLAYWFTNFFLKMNKNAKGYKI